MTVHFGINAREEHHCTMSVSSMYATCYMLPHVCVSEWIWIRESFPERFSVTDREVVAGQMTQSSEPPGSLFLA